MSLPSSGRPLSPLNIPELLEQIFLYIDRYTIAKTVVLVCRQWFLLNQHHLHREVAWDETWKPVEPKKALKRLPGAERLVIHTLQWEKRWQGHNVYSAVKALQKPPHPLWLTLSSFLHLRHRRHKQATYIAETLHRPLREIVLMMTDDFSSAQIDCFPYPSTLRSLTIEREIGEYFDIVKILAMCPLLESLHLLSHWACHLYGTWTSLRNELLPTRLPLRSLVLKQPQIYQEWVEDLLKVTSDLEDLQLITISNAHTHHWDWPRFSRHLQTLSLPLKQFHYSIMWSVWADDKQEEEIFATCPQAQERTFLAHHLTPRIAECLKDQLVALTTLNILLPSFVRCYRDGYLRHENHHSTRYTPQIWHQLLCECPNLRHLKTLKMPYMVEYMDLYRRNSMLPPIDDSHRQSHVQPVPGIWICRGLETLHLDLHIHDNTHMGIAYGYVARVCPYLQDLRISFPGYCNFGGGHGFKYQRPFLLEEGLCLLSRLGRLERLRVEYYEVECEIAELNWLCRSGRAAEHRARRREIVDGWTSRLEEEAVMEVARLESSARASMDIIGVGAVDEALMASLSNLGLLQDVKDTIAEIDADECVCLPELQQVACGDHLEQRPEKEIRSLFYVAPPTLKAKWLKKSNG